MKLVLEQDPSARFNRAGHAIEGALEILAGLRVKSQDKVLDAQLSQVCTALGITFDSLQGLIEDFQALVKVLPDTVEIEVANQPVEPAAAPPAAAPVCAAKQAERPKYTPGGGVTQGTTGGLFDDPRATETTREPVDDGSEAEVDEPLVLPTLSDGELPEPAPGTAAVRRTSEQDNIVYSDERTLAINAGAGTGKTFTLVEYANFHRNLRMLYLAFNKAIAEEAQRKFGANVKAQTSHSLAFGRVGRDYADKLGNPRAKEVLELLQGVMRIPVSSAGDEYMFAQAAVMRVRQFFADGSMHPGIRDEDTDESYHMPSGVDVDGREVATAARHLWAAMSDRQNMQMKMPHDGYLKLWMLSKPDLSRYDVLLLDEAQDTNPAVMAVVQAQTRMRRCLVGDRHQNIYGFRGSLNAMSKLRGAKQFSLTRSFRFGPNVAYVANSILAVFCGERTRLVGAGRREMPEVPRVANLFRTNAGLFGQAVDWIESNGARDALGLPKKSEEGEPVRGLHFVGGVENYQFELISDTFYLKDGASHLVSDPFIRRFQSFDQLQEYADAVEDRELLARIGIVDKFDHRIPELVDKVKKAHVGEGAARLHLTTAHKSKGLEWDEVTLGEDFPELLTDFGVPKTRRFLGPNAQDGDLLDVAEANLLYVASTRARCTLHQNKALHAFLDWCTTHGSKGAERDQTAAEYA
ncbi:UvrD-helicase domain-containing protein [Ottowia sp.]|uniref:UvrD-helicase domain-containing protein n=1 Tax=Ottowia sp. TaxID=1898956 RepID=UPI0025E069F6|nr:UvrD-helicase domain-containing protein [Ottowia sp.]MBK6616262.1 ATP-dependent helicase [Ottowia sp.]